MSLLSTSTITRPPACTRWRIMAMSASKRVACFGGALRPRGQFAIDAGILKLARENLFFIGTGFIARPTTLVQADSVLLRLNELAKPPLGPRPDLCTINLEVDNSRLTSVAGSASVAAIIAAPSISR